MNGEKEKKIRLREKIKGLLSKYNPSLLEAKSKLIQSHLFSLPEYKDSPLPMFYVSIEREVHTHEMIKAALSQKKEIALPLILKSQNIILPCKISDFLDLESGPFGILQPSKEKIQSVSISSLDFVIVPGIVFDKKGNRVGRGKGFYDRFLKLMSPQTTKIGFAFSFQIVEQVPVNENDIAMDKIVTENGVIKCK